MQSNSRYYRLGKMFIPRILVASPGRIPIFFVGLTLPLADTLKCLQCTSIAGADADCDEGKEMATECPGDSFDICLTLYVAVAKSRSRSCSVSALYTASKDTFEDAGTFEMLSKGRVQNKKYHNLWKKSIIFLTPSPPRIIWTFLNLGKN